MADTLAGDLKDGKFDELVLVAPPGVIAELKESRSSKPTAKIVVKELHKDLTKVPLIPRVLTGHLLRSNKQMMQA